MPFVTTSAEHRFPRYVRLFFADWTEARAAGQGWPDCGFWNQRRKYGAVLEPTRLWGRSPRVFVGVATLYGALNRRASPIEPALRSLITVRVSQINWCAFCVDINSALVQKRGGDLVKLADLERFETSAHFSEREKAALAYAEAITWSDRQPTAEHFARLRRCFDDDAIIELTAIVAFQNLSSKFNAALGVEPQGFCAVAPQPRQQRYGG